MTRHSLVLRMLLCHVTAASAVGMAWAWGWLDQLIATDTLYLVRVNCALGVMGICVATARAVWLGREMDDAAGTKLRDYLDSNGSASIGFQGLQIALNSRIGAVPFVAGTILSFGLAGTIVGFVLALSGVTPESASDPAAVGPMVAAMMSGVGIALYKTLAGIVLAQYLFAMHRMLSVAGAHVLSIAARGV